MTDNNEDIDNILDSDRNTEENVLDLNADTETMNSQLNKQLAKNKNNSQSSGGTTPQKIVQIDRDTLRALIVEWLALDDQLKSYRDTMKDMTEEKKQYETQILELMTTMNQNSILTDKGNILKNEKESKTPLTPEHIKATLSELLKCPQTADTYTTQIMDKRQVKKVCNLKREDPNKKNRKDKGKKEKTHRKKKNEEPLDV